MSGRNLRDAAEVLWAEKENKVISSNMCPFLRDNVLAGTQFSMVYIADNLDVGWLE